ncbi:MAG: glycosyltransferase [Dokdonella sp.]
MNPAPLAVTHVVENLNRGGLERVVIDLVLAQRAAGDRVRVVCLFEPGALAGELTSRGVEVSACRKGSGFDLAALRRLRVLLGADDAHTVVHTHNLLAHDYAALALLGIRRSAFLNTRHGMGGTPVGRLRATLYRLSMPRTDRVVAVCAAAQRNLIERERLPAAKVVSVPNGIPIETFTAASAAAHERLTAVLGLSSATRIVGFVGRLNWAKDLPTLLRAFAQVRTQRADAALVLVGDGALRAELEALAAALGIAAHVHFLGDRNDVRELLPGFDLFAMSSVTEGYSIALLEAAATGLPIVATAVGGNAEIARDGVNGRSVPSGDPAALAAAVEALLGEPAEAVQMGRRGREWALREATVERMHTRYRELYESIAKGSP